jgi:MFS family permease
VSLPPGSTGVRLKTNNARFRPDRAVTRARVAVAVTFFVNGSLIGTWAARIPAVKGHLGLDAPQLGLALLGPTLGSLAGIPLAGALVAHRGSRPVTRAAVFAHCGVVPLAGLAPNLVALWAALLAFGLANGLLDVSMNAQGIAVERAYHRPIMASFHGLFSLGALAGALGGSAAAALRLSVAVHFTLAAVVLAAVGAGANRWLLAAGDGSRQAVRLARPSRWLVLLGLIGFCCLFGEGAAGDWSAVFLREVRAASPAVAALAFAAFSLAMTGGRLLGDRATARWGPRPALRTGASVAAGGLLVALLIPTPAAGILGFGLLGAGLSITIPIVFSSAGRAAWGLKSEASTTASGDPRQPSGSPPVNQTAAGPAIAAVTGMSYLGGLAGPPLIGMVAGQLGLTHALGLIVVLAAVAAVLAGAAPATQATRPLLPCPELPPPEPLD